MTDEPVPLARLLAMSYRWMIDQLHERLAASGWEGIRPAYGFVLLVVRGGPITPTALAERLGVSKQAASKLADSMVSAGLMVRGDDVDDGRQRRLSLAPLGRKLLADVEKIYADLETEWTRVIGTHGVVAVRDNLTSIMLTINNGEFPDLRPDTIDTDRTG